jgi:ribosomal protein S20
MQATPPSETKKERTETTKVQTQTNTKKRGIQIALIAILLIVLVAFIIFLYPEYPKNVTVTPSPVKTESLKVIERLDAMAKENGTQASSVKTAIKEVNAKIDTVKSEIARQTTKIVSTEIEKRIQPVYDRMAVLEKKQEEFEKKVTAPPAPSQTQPAPTQNHTVTIEIKQLPQGAAAVVAPPPQQTSVIVPTPPPAPPVVVVPNAPPPQVHPPQPAATITTLPSVPPPPGWKRVIPLGPNEPSRRYSVSEVRLKKVTWDDDPQVMPTVVVRTYLNKRHVFASREFLEVKLPLDKEKLHNVDSVVFIPTTKPTYIYER